MSADQLVFDMSSQSEGTPSVFVRKDWLSILDNQNQNYQGNQSVIDTSQLANSNKYMNYREAYFTCPLMLTLTGSTTGDHIPYFEPATAATSADFVVGLKNWYGSIVHSFTLDYNGTTIIQQTPYIGMWNTFKLMTSLSIDDLISQSSQLGFYPDSPLAWSYQTADSENGSGTSNNQNAFAPVVVSGAFNSQESFNNGLLQRQLAWNFDLQAATSVAANATTFSAIMPQSSFNQLWKSYIFNKVNQGAVGQSGAFQVAITSTIYLKHLASFFERVPLLKGVFMRMTLNLNQSSVSWTMDTNEYTAVVPISPLGGVQPIMLSSAIAGNGASTLPDGNYIASVCVGNRVLNTSQTVMLAQTQSSPLGGSVILNVPAYTFNPVFESSYLSSPIKKIVYTDVYQYQVINSVKPSVNFNNLISNGIANIKSVLVLPFQSTTGAGASPLGYSPIQSPFDPAGAGPTSPLCLFSQFNIQISGQNAIYNTERYSYEQFLNQLHGANAVNGALTDGMTSGLIDQKAFESEYAYYYVNCGRMLPVEEAVPKSVSILGLSMSAFPVDLFVYVEYGVEVSLDILTGARV